jgi:hypothetical protein
MWFLHFLPDSFIQFIVHAILIAGLIGSFLSFFVVNKVLRAFPFLSQYVTIAQVASAVLLVAGVYFEGGYSTEMQWRERVREMEAKVAVAEQQAKEANVVIDKKGQEKIKVIREKGVVVKQYIDREVTKYDTTCVIPEPVVKAHNAAAKNEELK